jgi:hypothetical protein
MRLSPRATGEFFAYDVGNTDTAAAVFTLSLYVISQLQSAPKRLALHEAVTTPHWGSPAALRFSRSGGRFGAVGEGGLVGLWRQDFISAVDGLGHAEWVGHCLSKAGTALTFLGDTGSQVGWLMRTSTLLLRLLAVPVLFQCLWRVYL